MPQILPKSRIAYLPVPKVACTSIKQMLFEAENGTRYTPRQRANGRMIYIHEVYPAVPYAELDLAELADLHRIAVVRDPVKRVLSAYGNRVVSHRELSAAKAGPRLAAANLPTDPDLATFLEHFEAYCAAIPTIYHHTRPQVDFLGQDPAWLSQLYRFSELGVLADDVRRMTGTQVALPWLQTGGPKISPADLTPQQDRKLRDLYAADYTVFGPWFDDAAPPKATRKPQ